MNMLEKILMRAVGNNRVSPGDFATWAVGGALIKQRGGDIASALR